MLLKNHPERFKKTPRTFLKTIGMILKKHRDVFLRMKFNEKRHRYECLKMDLFYGV